MFWVERTESVKGGQLVQRYEGEAGAGKQQVILGLEVLMADGALEGSVRN